MSPDFEPGDVLSEGTLLPADLIRAFTGAINTGEGPKTADLKSGLTLVTKYDDDEINYPTSEVFADHIGGTLESLMDELNELAPDGCYFGSHPDDGALYGFFEQEEL